MKKQNKVKPLTLNTKKCKWLKAEVDYINNHSSKIPKRRKKFMKQLETQGWTDADTWSLEHVLAKWMTPRLKRFKELNNGHPMDLNEKKWNAIIQKMIDAFEIIGSDDYFMLTDKKKIKRMNEGLDLFRQYFHDLWW